MARVSQLPPMQRKGGRREGQASREWDAAKGSGRWSSLKNRLGERSRRACRDFTWAVRKKVGQPKGARQDGIGNACNTLKIEYLLSISNNLTILHSTCILGQTQGVKTPETAANSVVSSCRATGAVDVNGTRSRARESNRAGAGVARKTSRRLM